MAMKELDIYIYIYNSFLGPLLFNVFHTSRGPVSHIISLSLSLYIYIFIYIYIHMYVYTIHIDMITYYTVL